MLKRSLCKPPFIIFVLRGYFKDFLDYTTLLSPRVSSPTIPSPPLPYPPLPPLASRPLRIGPVKSRYGVWGALWAPQRGLGRIPSRILDFGAFRLKIWLVVATVLMIFLRINWPNAILDSTFFVLDSTFWLDSTFKIDPDRPRHSLITVEQWTGSVVNSNPSP